MEHFETFIAWRYLVTKRKEAFISIINIFAIIGIALGVATLIVVMAVMDGYESELINKILGLKGHVTILKQGGITDLPSLIDLVHRDFPEAELTPLVEGQAMVIKDKATTGSLIKGVTGAALQAKPLTIYPSSVWSRYDNAEGVIIGTELANSLGAALGDHLKLVVPQFNNTVVGAIPRSKTVEVIGFFDTGMHEYNASVIFMPLSLSQLLFKRIDTVDCLELNIRDPKQVPAMVRGLSQVLPRSFHITDWRDANQSLMAALEIESSVMFTILSLIIMIASFNIISSLMILVKDKSRGIAILRSCGASKRSVVVIFMLCGVAIGVIGTALGTALGVLLSLHLDNIRLILQELTGVTIFDPMIYFLNNLPAKLSFIKILRIIVMSLSFSFVATIYPAWKISRLSPAAILRYE